MTQQPATEATESGRRLRYTRASDIKIRAVRWTWTDRIPAGALSLVPGREGIGKSLFLAFLSAALTRGTLPGLHYGTPRPVLYAATEDSWSHTIAPRLVAAGADLDMVFRVEVEQDLHADQLTLPKDCAALAADIREMGVALLAADPLLSLIAGHIDTHRDRDLRTALEPLSKMADQTGCAVVGLAHFNKSSSTDPSTLITGSRAFTAVARAVLPVARDTVAGDGSCVLSQQKSNLGTLDLPSLRYVVESCDVETYDEGMTTAGKLVFTGEAERSVEDILSAAAGTAAPGGDQLTGAAAWLVSYLMSVGGEAPRTEVVAAASGEGISESTLRRSMKKARVTSVLRDFPATATYKLDMDHAPSPPVAQDASSVSSVSSHSLTKLTELTELATESHSPSLFTVNGSGVAR